LINIDGWFSEIMVGDRCFPKKTMMV